MTPADLRHSLANLLLILGAEHRRLKRVIGSDAESKRTWDHMRAISESINDIEKFIKEHCI